MNNDLSQYLTTVKELFHTEMGEQTSACLYGSAATDNWVAARSDLDLFALVPEEKIELFGEKIKIWKSNPANPILDGYVLYSSGNVTMARTIHKYEKAARLTRNFIPLIDLWNVKNQSVHLFGQDVKAFIPKISQEELKDWAIIEIENYWIPLLCDGASRSNPSSDVKIPLSILVWVASGVARMLMLAEGNICTSKRESLHWLADKYSEIREKINLFSDDFEKSDDLAITLSVGQATDLGRFYLGLLRAVKR